MTKRPPPDARHAGGNYNRLKTIATRERKTADTRRVRLNRHARQIGASCERPIPNTRHAQRNRHRRQLAALSKNSRLAILPPPNARHGTTAKCRRDRNYTRCIGRRCIVQLRFAIFYAICPFNTVDYLLARQQRLRLACDTLAAIGDLEFTKFFIGEQLCRMPLFNEFAVSIHYEKMRDAAAVQIKRIAALRLHDRELDVMLLRPGERLLVILVAREVDKLDVRIVFQRFCVCLRDARHFPAARRAPRRREEAEVELGILLEIFVEQEVTNLKLLCNNIHP